MKKDRLVLGGCTSSPRAGPVGLRSKQCLGIWSAGTSSFAPRSRAAVCNPLTVGIRGEADEVRLSFKDKETLLQLLECADSEDSVH